ncbi:MAG: beta-galactosidase, partial [Thermoguttaceae bacterium]
MCRSIASSIVVGLVFVVLLFCSDICAVETVRVGMKDDVPHILVDGEPVRTRMFFGNPGSRPIAIGTEPQIIQFVFRPLETELERATVHFRFDQKPATIVLDDILVEEVTTDSSGAVTATKNVFGPCHFENGMSDFDAEWQFWPNGEANTTGAIHVEPKVGQNGSSGLVVQRTAPKSGNWPDFHFFHKPNLALDRKKEYRVSLWIKSDVPNGLCMAFYRPGTTFTLLGITDDFFERQIQMANKAGARFISFSIPLPWPAPGKPVDWSAVDSACRRVLNADPNALLLPRVPMDPPQWWVDSHPGDVIRWEGTPHEARRVAAVSSTKYRQEAAQRLEALVRHLEATFGPNMAGYHPCGQNTGEWFYQDSWGPALNGYAESDAAAWKAWLASRYKNDAGLKAAWKDENVSLENVAVPTSELRRSLESGVLRDIAVNPQFQAVLDFNEFQQEQMADTVLAFAKTVRDASGGKRLVVFFYGYVFEFGAIQT